MPVMALLEKNEVDHFYVIVVQFSEIQTKFEKMKVEGEESYNALLLLNSGKEAVNTLEEIGQRVAVENEILVLQDVIHVRSEQ